MYLTYTIIKSTDTINSTWTHDIMEIDCIGRVKFLVSIDLVKYAGM